MIVLPDGRLMQAPPGAQIYQGPPPPGAAPPAVLSGGPHGAPPGAIVGTVGQPIIVQPEGHAAHHPGGYGEGGKGKGGGKSMKTR